MTGKGFYLSKTYKEQAALQKEYKGTREGWQYKNCSVILWMLCAAMLILAVLDVTGLFALQPALTITVGAASMFNLWYSFNFFTPSFSSGSSKPSWAR